MRKLSSFSWRNIFFQPRWITAGILLTLVIAQPALAAPAQRTNDTLERAFVTPPDAVRPGVFWQWMGGMLSREGITKDLEAMATHGVGAVMVMQMPDQAPYPQRWDFRDYPGKVKVLSDEWFSIVNHAVGEADRLGITFSIFICPGWSHAGGPWVTPQRGLKKLVSANTKVKGPMQFNAVLEKAPRSIGMGGGNEMPAWFGAQSDQKLQELPAFYKDVAVIAFPSGEKKGAIPVEKMIDLTSRMNADGTLKWDVPAGNWTIERFGIASENGVNHPAPFEGTGLEADRMDPEAVRIVFDGMVGRILREAKAKGYRSFKAFETDSYEAGIQDFGLDYRDQFKKRRGYDCIPWLPSWLDKSRVVGSSELTERFRNDMTRTISELTAERFHKKLRALADENGVEWMIEPYFRLRIDWRMSGAQSELPGAEFWIGKPFGYMGPAPDIAALYGLPVVWAEAFTAESYTSAWRNDPLLLKPWGDAVFARGINQFYMHGFVHNPFGDHLQPGMTMTYWGTQFSRHVTWWPFSDAWHRYLARCQFMLRQGRPVNDVLAYPAIIQPVPGKVLDAGSFRQVVLDDEAFFERLWVRDDGRIAVKGGGDFAAIALTPGMTLRPEALQQLRKMVDAGATLIGRAPEPVSSSLENYPACDQQVNRLINELWGGKGSGKFNAHALGKGKVLDTDNLVEALNELAGGPDVQFLDPIGNKPVNLSGVPDIPFRIMEVQLLEEPPMQSNALNNEKFKSLDFTHRRDGSTDIYFVCNGSAKTLDVIVDFRAGGRIPELWDPVTGEMQTLANWRQHKGRTKLPLKFGPQQSFFVVFRAQTGKVSSGTLAPKAASARTLKTLSGPWEVTFDPKWGGPKKIQFDKLVDWSKHPEKSVKYYSGTAAYRQQFDMPATGNASPKLFIDLGQVYNLARVTLNGKSIGVVWCAPWRLELPAALLQKQDNELTIEVVNTWVNRLIGDEQEPEDCELIEWDPDTKRKGSYDLHVGSRGLKDLPDWVVNGGKRPSAGRYTFTTWRFYDKTAPLRPSGLLGPVKIISIDKK